MNKKIAGRVAFACFFICLLIMISWIEGWPAGQQCDFGGDCGLNETCRSVPFSSREPGDKTGICVPKSW